MSRLIRSVIVAMAMTQGIVSASTVYAGEGPERCKDALKDGEPKLIALDFEGVYVSVAAHFFDKLTGKQHVVIEGFGRKFDLVESDPISVDTAHRRFLAAVEQLGYTVSTDGDTIRLTAPGSAPPANTP